MEGPSASGLVALTGLEAPRGVGRSVQFAVLASGSRGNATLVRGDGAGLLIDAGIGPKAMTGRLTSVGADWSDIAAVALTHTHGDHVDSATLAELARRRIGFHCHDGHRAVLSRDPGFLKLEEAGLVSPYGDRPFLTATGARLEPIPLEHDGMTFGFRIELSPARRARPVCIGYMADTGCWTDGMADVLTDVDVLGVEFNHDEAMQKSSGRPWVLIRRNLGDRGHLSNRQGAELVEAVLRRSRLGGIRHVVLLHLSRQCNRPELAIDAARSAARAAGRRVIVHAALQDPAHPNLWISPARRGGRVAPRTTSRPGPDRSPMALAGLFDDLDDPGDPAGAP
jgi:phosphoribosyl 1,2-cyclic phosphodiesterase